MTSIGTLWRTVRHLKPQQVIGRLRLRLQRPRPDLRPAPTRRARSGEWVAPAMREPSLIAPRRLRFLNVEHDLDRCGWDDASLDKLWRYNLHYFDDLNARDAPTRTCSQRALIANWVEANPPACGTGWEPYPVSLRVVNWIKWFTCGTTPETAWLDCLAVQVRWLERRLEVHLLGNHLFANAKALIFAGLFFEGVEADGWLQCGVEVMRRQLPEQVLTDGGQFERSTMYHALALEDVLDLINVTAALAPASSPARYLDTTLRSNAGHMLYWLRCMSHPDDSLSLFNDASAGVAPSLTELERYAAQLGIRAPRPPVEGIAHLSESGYVRASRGAALALLDVAPLGPEYQPGHGHADTLSFEFSLGRHRVIVNGGTSCYGTGAQRLHERSTAAHSTVQVADADSSEVWNAFRVGRRARPSAVVITDWQICCSHDGYRFLPGRPEHRRCWRLGVCELVVDDRVVPSGLPAVARYILAPGLRLHSLQPAHWRIFRDGALVVSVEVIQGQANAVSAHHAPRFGVLLTVDCLAVTLVDGRASTRWTWADDSLPLADFARTRDR